MSRRLVLVGAIWPGDKLLVCELTLRDGRVQWDLNGRAGQDWKTVSGNN
ncbi:MAG: hypothetical protein H0W08_23670 [Acidobacteria bacterium]|nr:hypothetical protein [Acidobacteriota bacterium]